MSIHQSLIRLGTGILLIAGISLAATEAYSQKSESDDTQFSDELIERTARVYVEIREIRSQYQQKLQSIDSPSRAAPLQRERREKIEELMLEHDITRQQYDAVTTAAQSNRDLYKRLREAIEAADERTSAQ